MNTMETIPMQDQEEEHRCELNALPIGTGDELWSRAEPAGALHPGATLLHFYVVRDEEVHLLDADPATCRYHVLPAVEGMTRDDLRRFGYRRCRWRGCTVSVDVQLHAEDLQ